MNQQEESGILFGKITKMTLKEAIQELKRKKLDPLQLRKLLLQLFNELKIDLEREVDEKIETFIKQAKGGVGPQGLRGDKGDKGDSITGPQGPEGKQGPKGKDGEPGRDGKDGKDGVGVPGPSGKDGSPDKPQEIADKLNTLTEKVEMSVIKGLLIYLQNLNKIVREKGGGGGGDIVKYTDLSGSLNSSTKTFTLPVHRRIVQVVGSSAPFIFRPTTDFTETRTSITFAAGIDATISLAMGQSLIVLWVA